MKRSILFGVVASAVIGLNLWACSDDDVSTGIANEISSSSEDAANEMPAGTSALIPEDTISNVSADTALTVPADSSTVPVHLCDGACRHNDSAYRFRGGTY